MIGMFSLADLQHSISLASFTLRNYLKKKNNTTAWALSRSRVSLLDSDALRKGREIFNQFLTLHFPATPESQMHSFNLLATAAPFSLAGWWWPHSELCRLTRVWLRLYALDQFHFSLMSRQRESCLHCDCMNMTTALIKTALSAAEII